MTSDQPVTGMLGADLDGPRLALSRSACDMAKPGVPLH
jgi:hypothetical protein